MSVPEQRVPRDPRGGRGIWDSGVPPPLPGHCLFLSSLLCFGLTCPWLCPQLPPPLRQVLVALRRVLLAQFSAFPFNGADLYEELKTSTAILSTGIGRFVCVLWEDGERQETWCCWLGFWCLSLEKAGFLKQG